MDIKDAKLFFTADVTFNFSIAYQPFLYQTISEYREYMNAINSRWNGCRSVQDSNATDLMHHLGIQLVFYFRTLLSTFIFICASDTNFNQFMRIESDINLSEDSISKTVLTDHDNRF